MTKKFEYYEAVSPDGSYKLDGRFDTEDEALRHINYSYRRALRCGFDNSKVNWLVVCVQVTKEYTADGTFQSETTKRFALYTAQYDFYDRAYVPAY